MASQINGAAQTALRVLRVSFNSPCADATAINPAVWTFSGTGSGPYYTPTALSVVGVDSQIAPTAVDITCDQEFTPAIGYVVSCTDVTGITVDSIHNAATFTGIVPVSPANRDIAIIDMMPGVNVSEDDSGDLGKFIACLQEVFNLLWNGVDEWGDIFDLDKAPERFVDLMLAELGSQIELPDLTIVEKRKLGQLLVSIYREKGSIPGIKAAIKFFVGLPSEVYNFQGVGLVLGIDYLGVGGPDPGTWSLGDGDPWTFIVKCGTPDGAALSASQDARVREIIEKMKVAHTKLKALRASYVAPVRADIRDNGAGSVTVGCSAITGAPSNYVVFSRLAPKVNEWNGLAAPMGIGQVLTVTPGAVRYWIATDVNPGTGIPSLQSNEVTNLLTKPVLTVTPQTRNLHLSWPAVVGATSYRIYKSIASAVRPVMADNASNPIRVSGDQLTYDDKVESGKTFFYVITPMIADSEGFYSNEATGTSL